MKAYSLEDQINFQSLLLEHLPAAVVSTDTNLNILTWNIEAEKLYGWSAAEAIGQYAWDIIRPAYTEEAFRQAKQVLFEKGIWRGRIRQYHKLGHPIYAEVTLKLLRSESNQAISFVAIGQPAAPDPLEQELLLHRERFQTALQAADLLGKTEEEVFPPELAQQLGPLKREVLTSGRSVKREITFSHQERQLTFYFVVHPLRQSNGQLTGLTSAAIDLTVLREAQQESKAREHQLQKVTDAVPVMIAYIDARERYRFVNQAYERWFSRSTTEIIGKTIRELMGEELYRKRSAYYQKVLAGETVSFEDQMTVQGKRLHVQLNLIPEIDHGVVKGFYLLGQDQTELREAQRLSLQSVQFYRTMARNFPNGVMLLINRDFRITFIEGQALQQLNRSADYYLNKRVDDVIPPEQKEFFYTYYRRAFAGETVTFRHEVMEQHHVLTATPIGIEGTITHILVVTSNITRQVQLEQTVTRQNANLEEAQRLAQLGFWEYDPRTAELRWSDMVHQLYGSAPGSPIPTLGELQTLLNPSERASVVRAFREAYQQHQPFQQTLSVILPSGRARYLQVQSKPVFDEQGQFIRQFGTVMDVSRFHQLEESVRLNQEKLRLAIKSARMVLFAQDRALRYTWVYNADPDYREEKLLGKTDAEIGLEPEAARRVMALKQRVIDTGKAISEEVWDTTTGQVRYYQLNAEPTFDASGQVTGLMAVTYEITQQKKVELELRERETLYRTLAENVPGLISLYNRNLKRTYINGQELHRMAVPASDLIGKSLLDDVEPYDLEKARHSLLQTFEGENQVFEATMAQTTYLFSTTPLREDDGTIQQIMVTSLNITAIKRAQQALLESELKFRELFESNIAGTAIGTIDGQLLEANPAFLNTFGYQPEDLRQGLNWQQITLRGYGERDARAIAQLREKGFCEPFEKECVRKDGSRIWVLEGASVMKGDHGHIVAFVLDITARKQQELALHESVARLRSLFETDAVGICYWDVDGKVTHANDYLLRLLGYTRAELEAGMIDWRKATPPEWRYTDTNAIGEILDSDMHLPYEKEYFRKDGSRVPILIGSAFLRDYHDRGISFIIDLTELVNTRKELEATALELQRSNEDLEQFAFVAAHDLQEPLSTLSGFIQLFRHRFSDLNPELNQMLGLISQTTKRMQQLINNLLNYSLAGSAKYDITTVDMNEVMQEVTELLGQRIADSGAMIEFADLPTVEADRSQMVQLLQNLLGNALKFRDPQRPLRVEVRGKETVQGWEFSVADTGIGMDMTKAHKIFQIFKRLHSRDAYEGTGIGLSICQRIVERHGGTIRVTSQPGVGSTFYFTIGHLVG